MAIYRPSSINVTDVFFEKVTTLLEAISTYCSELVIVGDFNIHVDHLHYVTASRFCDLLYALGWCSTCEGHTRGHKLDLVITRPTCVPTLLVVDAPIFSDYALIICCLTIERPPPAAPQRKTIRRLGAIDMATFTNAVSRSFLCASTAELSPRSTEELCDIYQTVLRPIIDDLASLIDVSEMRRPTSPWFDSDCRECRRHTRACERRHRHSLLPTDLLAWSAALAEKRALFDNKMQAYWTARLRDCKDSKHAWQCLNAMLMRTDDVSPPSTQLTAQSWPTTSRTR